MSYWSTIGDVAKHVPSAVSGIIAFILLFWFMAAFSDYELIAGNLGAGHHIVTIITQSVLAILFGANVALLVHKQSLNMKARPRRRDILGTVGAFIGSLVAGCAACGITLASYIGLSAALSALPFFGLELKIAGIIILVYANHILIRDMYICRPRPKKSSTHR